MHKEVNAFLTLGSKVEGDELLVVDWYRLQGNGERVHLFTHEIEGVPGRARSQGLAREGLEPGIYETVATLGDLQVRSPWVVTSGTSASADAARSGDVPSAGVATSGEASATGPAPGGTGGECDFSNLHGGVALFLEASVDWSGDCSVVALGASVQGPVVLLKEEDVSEQSPRHGRLRVEDEWLCALPGASDLPGAVVRFTALDEKGFRLAKEVTLGDFGEVLRAGIATDPGRGVGVKPREKIDIVAIALLAPPALGVERLDVTVNGVVIESTRNLSENAEPVGCDLGRLFALLETRYRVPRNPPPVITICAEALGFDSTRSRDCAEFYTGEVWTGTVYGTIKILPPGQPGPVCPNPINWTGYAEFVVSGDGRATGTLTVRGVSDSCLRSSKLKGTVTEEGVRFPHLEPVFTSGPIPIVSPGRAKGRFTHTGATTKYSTTWNLKCKTCDD